MNYITSGVIEMKIGSHVSNSGKEMILGSVVEAINNGATALMIYLGAPQNSFRKKAEEMQIEKAVELANKNGILQDDIIVHLPYIVNLANPEIEKRNYAKDFLLRELKLAEQLNLKYLVLHPGARLNDTLDNAINNIGEGINYLLDQTNSSIILLETMAGKGSEVGRNFSEIKAIIDLVKQKNRIGVCLDTCHINDAGYDIVNNYEGVIEEFSNTIGLNYLKVIHLNDSKNVVGSHKDRHENIGIGTIGFDTLYKIATDNRFVNIPKILETPYIKDGSKDGISPYKSEIRMLRTNNFDKDWIKNLLNN